jgi:hypothetical protein
MGSKATHQFPVLNDPQPTDLVYVAVEVSPGVFVDRSAPLSIFPAMQRHADRLLTSAEILDLFDTPIELVSAPSDSQMIKVDLITMRAIGGTTPYTGSVWFGGSTINVGNFIVQDALPDDTAPYRVVYPTNAGGAGVDQGMAPEEALRVMGAGSDPTGGNCDVFVRVHYTLINV